MFAWQGTRILTESFNYILPQKERASGLEAIIERLIVPITEKKTFADRAFSVIGPKVWNSLPNNVKTQEDVDQFKRSLKTHLFKKAFNT